MKQKFVDINLKASSLDLIDQANKIIAEYQGQGYRLTLRQLYYQHVARGLIENNVRSYKNLGELVNKARLSGLIDWAAIEDRTRNLEGVSHWSSPASIIYSAYQGFRIDKWKNQPYRFEVWVEKEALSGVVSRVCRALDVDYFACRGYVSQSEMYDAAQRMAGYVDAGQRVAVLHLGDHDPSGLDMTRDNFDRLTLLMGEGYDLEVTRLALNIDQVHQYNPPPNPAKLTDARFGVYSEIYGRESWELDALEPSVIEELIADEIMGRRDEGLWEESQQEEYNQRHLLSQVSDRWGEVQEFLEKPV